MAVSVLPMPLGPTSMNTPIGRRGSVRFGPRRANALGDGVQGVRLADDPLFHLLLEIQHGLDFVGHHAADGDAGPGGDHVGHGLGIDADLHQRRFALQRFQFGADSSRSSPRSF